MGLIASNSWTAFQSVTHKLIHRLCHVNGPLSIKDDHHADPPFVALPACGARGSITSSPPSRDRFASFSHLAGSLWQRFFGAQCTRRGVACAGHCPGHNRRPPQPRSSRWGIGCNGLDRAAGPAFTDVGQPWLPCAASGDRRRPAAAFCRWRPRFARSTATGNCGQQACFTSGHRHCQGVFPLPDASWLHHHQRPGFGYRRCRSSGCIAGWRGHDWRARHGLAKTLSTAPS